MTTQKNIPSEPIGIRRTRYRESTVDWLAKNCYSKDGELYLKEKVDDQV